MTTEPRLDSPMRESDGSRKPYSKPQLKEYGPVAYLTRGGAPSALSDSGTNMMFP